MVTFDKNAIDEEIRSCWDFFFEEHPKGFYHLRGITLDSNYSDPGDKHITLATCDDLYELKVWCDLRNIKIGKASYEMQATF